MRAFDQAVQENLECRLVTHVERMFPAEFARLGKRAVEQRVRAALDRAKGRKLVEDYDLCRFVDLTFLLGEGFEADERFPWAARTLDDDGLTAAEKMDRLCLLAAEHLGNARPPQAIMTSKKTWE
jgi:hypothetical protein